MIKKYQVTIKFEMTEEMMSHVPAHRVYINSLINKKIIDLYTVSIESFRSWIVINAKTKKEVQNILSKTPLFPYWTIEIDELFVYDGQTYRLPSFELN
jgi:muconolactone delta-isomerase